MVGQTNGKSDIYRWVPHLKNMRIYIIQKIYSSLYRKFSEVRGVREYEKRLK